MLRMLWLMLRMLQHMLGWLQHMRPALSLMPAVLQLMQRAQVHAQTVDELEHALHGFMRDRH